MKEILSLKWVKCEAFVCYAAFSQTGGFAEDSHFFAKVELEQCGLVIRGEAMVKTHPTTTLLDVLTVKKAHLKPCLKHGKMIPEPTFF